MRAKPSLLVTLAVALGIMLVGLTEMPGDVSASLRAGAGIASVGGGLAPLGRVAVDLLPLSFFTLSVDAEYWFFSLGSQQLLPFFALGMSVSMPWILQATVGMAPVVSILPSQGIKGISVVPHTLVVKAGLEVPAGPLGIFGEALFLVSASDAYSDGAFFALGVTLEF